MRKTTKQVAAPEEITIGQEAEAARLAAMEVIDSITNVMPDNVEIAFYDTLIDTLEVERDAAKARLGTHELTPAELVCVMGGAPGSYIAGLRMVRERTGCDLHTARSLVDPRRPIDTFKHTNGTPHTVTGPGGCWGCANMRRVFNPKGVR